MRELRLPKKAGLCLGLALVFATGLLILTGAQMAQARTPLEEAKASLIALKEWRFQIDPMNAGERDGWMNPSFDDRSWPILSTDKRWEEQGYAGYDGYAWYRAQIDVPAHWQGSRILLQSDGIDDQYDLFVNGVFIRHFGNATDLSVWQSPTEAELGSALRYGERNSIAIRVLDNGGGGGIWRRILLRRVPPFEPLKGLLPTPILDAHPQWVKLYWDAWRMAWSKVSFGDAENGFVPAYMDEGYNEHIYQWDSIFMTLFGRYGRRLFPVMGTLDNFYLKQDPDGYIARVYSETTGLKMQIPTAESPMTNPPLFAWAEWEYFKLTGDQSRFARVLPILERYDNWLKTHQRSSFGQGLYYMTGFDSGMDNMPRPNAGMAGWVDPSLQQALAAKYMALIAHELGHRSRELHWKREYIERRDLINKLCWNETDGIYYDVDRDGRHTGVKHIGAMWALLSQVADSRKAARLVGQLQDPKEFYRPHLFPALSVSDPGFTDSASYWRGGVWAPTNYMTIRGLMAQGYESFAHEAALNHLSRVAEVYASAVDGSHVDPNEADGEYQTVWECYNPNQITPCTRADAYYFGRQDFVGWTGLGPIALLIEQAVGLDVKGAENRVVWRLKESGRVGILNLDVGAGNRISLVAEPFQQQARRVSVEALRPFALKIMIGDKSYEFTIPSGRSVFKLTL